MANKTGIAITAKLFIETGKDMASQFAAMSAVMNAKQTGDYNEIFKLGTVEELKSEQVTRRVPVAAASAPATTAPADTSAAAGEAAQVEGSTADNEPAAAQPEGEEEPAEVPAFLRSGAVAAE